MLLVHIFSGLQRYWDNIKKPVKTAFLYRAKSRLLWGLRRHLKIGPGAQGYDFFVLPCVLLYTYLNVYCCTTSCYNAAHLCGRKKDHFDPQKGTPKKASFLALTNPLDSYLHLGCSCFYANRIATWSYKYPPSLLVIMLGSCCVTKSYGFVYGLLRVLMWEPVSGRARVWRIVRGAPHLVYKRLWVITCR